MVDGTIMYWYILVVNVSNLFFVRQLTNRWRNENYTMKITQKGDNWINRNFHLTYRLEEITVMVDLKSMFRATSNFYLYVQAQPRS